MGKKDQISPNLIRLVERLTGQPVEKLTSETLWEKRRRGIVNRKRDIKFTRNFPTVGRGCVLGDHLSTTTEVNDQVDILLRD